MEEPFTTSLSDTRRFEFHSFDQTHSSHPSTCHFVENISRRSSCASGTSSQGEPFARVAVMYMYAHVEESRVGVRVVSPVVGGRAHKIRFSVPILTFRTRRGAKPQIDFAVRDPAWTSAGWRRNCTLGSTAKGKFVTQRRQTCHHEDLHTIVLRDTTTRNHPIPGEMVADLTYPTHTRHKKCFSRQSVPAAT